MIKSGRTINRVWLGIFLGSSLLVGVACGGGNGSSGGNTAVEAVVPTMPPARFTAVASQSVLTATIAVTAVTITTTNVTTAATSNAAGNPALERGARSYAKNNCAICHGEQGEGVPGKGKAIAGTALTLQEFDTWLRTGGGLGADHIFGPSAISPGGMETLHTYVQSLGQ